MIRNALHPSAGFHNDTNTALQTIACYVGDGSTAALDEELLLGIGGGVGYGYFTFYYEKEDFTNFHWGTRAIWEDSAAFIGGIFSSLGLRLRVQSTKDRKAAFEALERQAGHGIPVIVPVHHGIFDGSLLDNNGFQTYCAVFGLDVNRGIARLAHRFAGGADISLEDLIHGRSRIATQKLANQSLVVSGLDEAGRGKADGHDPEAFTVTSDLIVAASRDGIGRCVSSADNPRMTNFGITALDKWIDRMNGRDKTGWIALFGPHHHWMKALHSTVYHIVANTDGVAFRSAYAAFLGRVGRIIQEPLLAEAAGLFGASAAVWGQLAEHMLPDDIPEARSLKAAMTDSERLVREGRMGYDEYIGVQDDLRRRKDALGQTEPWSDKRKKDHLAAAASLVAAIREKETAALALLRESLRSTRWSG